MSDRFEPMRIQADYLVRVGYRAMLLEWCRDCTSLCVPGYEFNNINETKRIAAARLLSPVAALANDLFPPQPDDPVGYGPNMPDLNGMRFDMAKMESATLVQKTNVVIYHLGLGEMIDYPEMHGDRDQVRPTPDSR